MASLPPEPILPAQVEAPDARCAPLALVNQWEALHRKAVRLGALARIAPEAGSAGFVRLVDEAQDWQRTLAAQGLEDIDAMLAPGLAALATLTERGQDAAAPALALWREFHAARGSVLAALGQTQPA